MWVATRQTAFDPECTSPVHQIWARDLSSGAPGQGSARCWGSRGARGRGAGRPSTQLRKTGGTRGRARGTRQPACLTGLPVAPSFSAPGSLSTRLPTWCFPMQGAVLHSRQYCYLARGGNIPVQQEQPLSNEPPGRPPSSQEPGANTQPASQSSPTNDSSCYYPIPHHSCNLISDGWVPSVIEALRANN